MRRKTHVVIDFDLHVQREFWVRSMLALCYFCVNPPHALEQSASGSCTRQLVDFLQPFTRALILSLSPAVGRCANSHEDVREQTHARAKAHTHTHTHTRTQVAIYAFKKHLDQYRKSIKSGAAARKKEVPWWSSQSCKCACMQSHAGYITEQFSGEFCAN